MFANLFTFARFARPNCAYCVYRISHMSAVHFRHYYNFFLQSIRHTFAFKIRTIIIYAVGFKYGIECGFSECQFLITWA